MADEKILTAYVQFETRGDTTADIERQRRAAASSNENQQQGAEHTKEVIEASAQQATAAVVDQYTKRTEAARVATTEAVSLAARMKTLYQGGTGAKTFGREDMAANAEASNMAVKMRSAWLKNQEGDSLKSLMVNSWQSHQDRTAAEAKQKADRAAESRQSMSVRGTNKNREDQYIAEQMARNMKSREQAEKEMLAQEKQLAAEQRQAQAGQILAMNASAHRWANLTGQVGQAFGALPGVHHGVGIAQQGIYGYQQHAAQKVAEGGTAAEARMAGVKGAGSAVGIAAIVTAIDQGFRGAAKANPQAFEKLEYQADRLQAAFGQSFVPLVEAAGAALERFNKFIGAPPLNNPRYSNFADVRDRLQLAALRGSGKWEGPGAGFAKGATMGPFGLIEKAADFIGGIGRGLMNALD